MENKLNEIKKNLYKFNPLAYLITIDKNGIHYACTIDSGEKLTFSIPFNDIGEAKFNTSMESKHLIRYINI